MRPSVKQWHHRPSGANHQKVGNTQNPAGEAVDDVEEGEVLLSSSPSCAQKWAPRIANPKKMSHGPRPEKRASMPEPLTAPPSACSANNSGAPTYKGVSICDLSTAPLHRSSPSKSRWSDSNNNPTSPAPRRDESMGHRLPLPSHSGGSRSESQLRPPPPPSNTQPPSPSFSDDQRALWFNVLNSVSTDLKRLFHEELPNVLQNAMALEFDRYEYSRASGGGGSPGNCHRRQPIGGQIGGISSSSPPGGSPDKSESSYLSLGPSDHRQTKFSVDTQTPPEWVQECLVPKGKFDRSRQGREGDDVPSTNGSSQLASSANPTTTTVSNISNLSLLKAQLRNKQQRNVPLVQSDELDITDDNQPVKFLPTNSNSTFFADPRHNAGGMRMCAELSEVKLQTPPQAVKRRKINEGSPEQRPAEAKTLPSLTTPTGCSCANINEAVEDLGTGCRSGEVVPKAAGNRNQASASMGPEDEHHSNGPITDRRTLSSSSNSSSLSLTRVSSPPMSPEKGESLFVSPRSPPAPPAATNDASESHRHVNHPVASIDCRGEGVDTALSAVGVIHLELEAARGAAEAIVDPFSSGVLRIDKGSDDVIGCDRDDIIAISDSSSAVSIDDYTQEIYATTQVKDLTVSFKAKSSPSSRGSLYHLSSPSNNIIKSRSLSHSQSNLGENVYRTHGASNRPYESDASGRNGLTKEVIKHHHWFSRSTPNTRRDDGLINPSSGSRTADKAGRHQFNHLGGAARTARASLSDYQQPQDCVINNNYRRVVKSDHPRVLYGSDSDYNIRLQDPSPSRHLASYR
eukprot:GHVH01012619.1.p1 GENE.GHVH01012619.1~~GHVH01012619.1.p1  ORF type:complete len:799 (+),score=109.60 GHVH01012619.1:1167-3563(+)